MRLSPNLPSPPFRRHELLVAAGRMVLLTTSKEGDDFRWTLDSGHSGLADSPNSARAAAMAAGSSPAARHSGQIYPAYDRRTGEGRVLEVRRGKLTDSGLRLPSKSAAVEYVKATRMEAQLA